jgi:hypothetical protein
VLGASLACQDSSQVTRIREELFLWEVSPGLLQRICGEGGAKTWVRGGLSVAVETLEQLTPSNFAV